MHPDVCAFTSEVFYEDKLTVRPGLGRQEVKSLGPIRGTGLRFVPVSHAGNQSSSAEEVEAVVSLVNGLTDGASRWIDRDGQEHPIGVDDVLIIAPYNAQVFKIQERLPGANVGTVDKFQGQEAPVVIYSMATFRSGGGSTRHGVSLQSKSAECSHIPGTLRVRFSGLPGFVQSRVSFPAPDAVGQRVLSLSGAGHCNRAMNLSGTNAQCVVANRT